MLHLVPLRLHSLQQWQQLPPGLSPPTPQLQAASPRCRRRCDLLPSHRQRQQAPSLSRRQRNRGRRRHRMPSRGKGSGHSPSHRAHAAAPAGRSAQSCGRRLRPPSRRLSPRRWSSPVGFRGQPRHRTEPLEVLICAAQKASLILLPLLLMTWTQCNGATHVCTCTWRRVPFGVYHVGCLDQRHSWHHSPSVSNSPARPQGKRRQSAGRCRIRASHCRSAGRDSTQQGRVCTALQDRHR